MGCVNFSPEWNRQTLLPKGSKVEKQKETTTANHEQLGALWCTGVIPLVWRFKMVGFCNDQMSAETTIQTAATV